MNSESKQIAAWRWSLRTMLLLMFTVSAWLAVWQLQTSIPQLEQDIARMESLLPNTLVLGNPSEAAIVHLRPTWYDEHIWELYLPPGASYSLNLASRNVDKSGLAEPTHTTALPAGNHRVELVRTTKVEDTWRTEIMVDGQAQIVCKEPSGWNSGQGSTGGNEFSACQHFSQDEDIVLFRRRWMQQVGNQQSQTPTGPSKGLLLWIAPALVDSE